MDDIDINVTMEKDAVVARARVGGHAAVELRLHGPHGDIPRRFVQAVELCALVLRPLEASIDDE